MSDAAGSIDRLMTSLAVRVNAFALCETEFGYRLMFARSPSVTLHYVLFGSGTIDVDGCANAYGPRCLIIAPAQVTHSLGEVDAETSIPASTATCGLLANGLVRFTAGDGRRDTLVMCATVTATYGGALGVLDGLQVSLVLMSTRDELFSSVFDTMFHEATTPGLGTQALVEALMKQALILLLRHHLFHLESPSPFLMALHNQRLAKVVAAVIEQPTTAWSVDVLASLV